MLTRRVRVIVTVIELFLEFHARAPYVEVLCTRLYACLV